MTRLTTHWPLRSHAGRRLVLLAALAASLSGLALPSSTAAHPLGNFTINRYHGLTISSQAAQVDRVVDMAEIPALQARHEMDVNADGAVSAAEGAAWARSSCDAAAHELTLTFNGLPASLSTSGLGLSFPPGQAGLLTLRLVCTYSAAFAPLSGPATVNFHDGTYAGRPGWQEIVVAGSAVQLSGASTFTPASDRLRSYPGAATQTARSQSQAEFVASPAGIAPLPQLPPDAVPADSPAELIVSDSHATTSRVDVAELPAEISAIFQAQDLTWPAILLSMGVAMLVGALHAASPGHGKTLMAAYLVGTRGTLRHALGLGLTVTISHTVGVLGLGAIVLLAGTVLPAERLFPMLGLAGGFVVTAIGLAMLGQRLKARRELATHLSGHNAAAPGHDHDEHPPGWHSHGVGGHTHLPPEESPLRRRNLIALGLVGGLVPSASAILILVGSIAVGRPAYGILLTIAFGLGMAAVLVGVGILLVRARNLLDRLPDTTRLAPLRTALPVATAAVFLVVGSVMTVQAGAQLL